ncbi:hypothetical protein [Flavicella marina]|uniref:hypothetical protein n=1 Tax=Flavicella marina TaxID=1475951 RepID=UPI0012644F5A|nr:hypothetical protein [Flavicella marina]
MGTENHSINSDKHVVSHSGILTSIQEYFQDKAEGLNLFEKVMLILYSSMTLFFLFAALYLVLTKGFKF